MTDVILSMKKILGIVALFFFLNQNAHADRVATFKCTFERDNYEYIINWQRNNYNEILIRGMQSKDIYYQDNLKSSADITVIEGDRSYNFKGFKNNGSNPVQHNFIFLDQSNTLFADLQATSFDNGIATEFDISSFDNALDKITKGTCKAIY